MYGVKTAWKPQLFGERARQVDNATWTKLLFFWLCNEKCKSLHDIIENTHTKWGGWTTCLWSHGHLDIHRACHTILGTNRTLAVSYKYLIIDLQYTKCLRQAGEIAFRHEFHRTIQGQRLSSSVHHSWIDAQCPLRHVNSQCQRLHCSGPTLMLQIFVGYLPHLQLYFMLCKFLIQHAHT